MYKFVTFLVLCLGLSVYGDLSPRIVGGEDVPIGKYSFQVSLRRSGVHTCAGSIINKRHILTAAHCSITLRWRSGEFKVHVGTDFRDEIGSVYEIENAFRHESYDGANHDIAILRVTRDIVFTDKVKPIPLATTDFVQPGDTGIVIGWGRLTTDGEGSNGLKELAVKVTTLEECNERPYDQASYWHICTSTAAGKGACLGDSGGPLLMNGFQVGIVSSGIPCALGFPDMFTKVSVYHDWINAKTKLTGY